MDIHLSISEVMKCSIIEVRNLPFFMCIAYVKAWATNNNPQSSECIDAEDPKNKEMVDNMLKNS